MGAGNKDRAAVGRAGARREKKRADVSAVPDRGRRQTAAPPWGRWPSGFFFGLRVLLGIVYLYASYDKILHPQAFAQAVYNYQILPASLVNLASLILPWLELALGVCLIAGRWLPGATVLSTGLLTVFIAALVYNRIRGLDVHCGCFSTAATEGPADLWTVARDVGFLAVSALLTAGVFGSRPFSFDLFHQPSTRQGRQGR